jgi:hypothetical protein
MSIDIWNSITSIATALAAIASVVAVFVAARAAKYASSQASLLQDQVSAGHAMLQLEVHSRFQSEVRSIQRTFSPDVNKPEWAPTEIERRSISLYWYLVFDEWLTCSKMHSTLSALWKENYSIGVQSALRNASFNTAARDLFKGDATFFGYGKEFSEEIDRLCREATGKPLL